MDLKEKPKFSQLWPQWVAALDVFVLKMLTGIAIGWLPPFLGLLRSSDSPFEATKDEISWIASLISFCKSLGVIMGSIAASYLGSKRAMNICVLFQTIGWIFLIFANSIEVVYITFICKGLNVGASMVVYPIYLSEISDPKIRGALISFVSQGLMIGMLLGNLMGTHLMPYVYAIIGIAITILFFITFFFLPQTPHYLIRCNKMDEASKSLQWYNRLDNNEKELEELSEFLDSSPKLPFFSMLKATFKNSVNRKMLFKFCLLILLIELSCLMVIGDFMVIIFTDAKVTALLPTTVMTILTFINIPASWIPVYIIDRYKRTTIYLVASIVNTISLLAFALTFTLLDYGYTDSNIQWIIIVAGIVYRVTITIGMLPIFFTFMSEIFAPNVKTISIGIVFIANGITSFLSHKYFVFFTELLTYKYVFYFATVITFIHGFYLKRYIPETKGKSLQAIQKMLNKNVNKKNVKDLAAESKLI